MCECVIEPVAYGSYAYHAARRLRDAILRRPLGLALTPEDVAGEDEQWPASETMCSVALCLSRYPVVTFSCGKWP